MRLMTPAEAVAAFPVGRRVKAREFNQYGTVAACPPGDPYEGNAYGSIMGGRFCAWVNIEWDNGRVNGELPSNLIPQPAA
jgi:hypothetical protein